MEFGALIRDARERLGMEQSELAQRLGVGQQAVSTWERGRGKPRRGAIEALARALELDEAMLLSAGGYQDKNTPPVMPLLASLPFDQLTDATFERFCRDLWAYRYPEASVSRNGDSGHAQQGVDVIVRLSEYTIGVQCKRHRDFGASAVQAAIDAVTDDAGVTRGVIALSRRLATPMARAQLKGQSAWSLEDGEDLSRAVRALPADQRLQLVDSYFPGYRTAFVGVAAPSPWLSEIANEPTLSGRAGYRRDFDLVGRESELTALQTFADGDDSVIVVTGAGGSGKTRLLTEFARRYKRRPVVFASRATISVDAFEVLPEDPVVVVDDAGDREGDLAALVSGIFRARVSARVILGVRTHHEDRVRQALKTLLWADLPRVDLRPLTLAAARELAADALGAGASALAVAALGANGRDCPLLIVIGAHLIREGRLDPSNVGTSGELRNEVLNLYADSLIGADDSRSRTQILEAVAAVQPVRMDDAQFVQMLAELLKLEEYEIPRAVDDLEHAGLLTRRAESVRITPDLLGDALLQRALITANGRPTGFSDRLAVVANGAPLRNALHNVAVTEWVARKHTSGDLSGALWDAIIHNALRATGSERIALANDIEGVAGARPESALQLARTILDNPAAPEQSPWAELFEADLTIGPAKVNQSLTRLIANAARVDLMPEAMSLLWAIGRPDDRPQNQNPDHGLRVLRELGSFDIGKPYAVTEVYVRTIGEWLGDPTLEVRDRSTLLKLLTPAVERAGHSEQSNGVTLTIQPFEVPVSEVASIRSAVLDIASAHLREDALVAAEALALLEHSVRNAGPDLDPEFERVASLVGDVIADQSLSVGTRLAAFRTLGWHATYGEGATQQRAKNVRRGFRPDLNVRLTRVLRSGWAFDDDDDAQAFTVEAGERRVAETARDLLAAYSDDEGLLDVLLAAIRAELAEREKFLLPSYLVTVLCADRASFAGAIVRRAASEPASDVTWQSLVGPAIAHHLDADLQEGVNTADRLLITSATWSPVIASAISSRRNAADSIEEAALIDRLLDVGDETTQLALLSGARWFDDSSTVIAEHVLRKVALDKYTSVANAAANLLAYGPKNVTWDRLTDQAKRDILPRLQLTPDISDYAVQALLVRAAIGREREVLRLLQARVEQTRERGKSFTPLPYHWHESPRFRSSSDYPDMMRDLAAWIAQLPADIRSWWAPKLFAVAAGPYDDEIQQLALSLVREGSTASVRAAEKILEEAPQEYGMQHPAFVAQILDAARAVNADSERWIGGALYSATMYGMRSRSIGEPDPADVRRIPLSRELARSFSQGSPARHFYEMITSASERNVERNIQDDEDLDDRRPW